MIFNILQVSGDHIRLLTAPLWPLFNVVYWNKGHCLETVKFNGCTRVRPKCSRDLFRTKTLANWLNQKDTAQNLKMQVYNVRKLHFQANLCEVFAENKQQHYCEDLVLGWAVLQKTVFNH